MDDLREQLATEGQMGTATIAYVWPLIEAALLRERSDTAERAGQAVLDYMLQRRFCADSWAPTIADVARSVARSGGGGTPEQGEGEVDDRD